MEIAREAPGDVDPEVMVFRPLFLSHKLQAARIRGSKTRRITRPNDVAVITPLKTGQSTGILTESEEGRSSKPKRGRLSNVPKTKQNKEKKYHGGRNGQNGSIDEYYLHQTVPNLFGTH